MYRFLSGRNLVVPASSSLDDDYSTEEDFVTPAPAPRPTLQPAKFEKSRFAVDGRKPKVKSNLKAKFRNKKGGGFFNKLNNDRKQFNSGSTHNFRNQFKHRGSSSNKNFGGDRFETTTTPEPFYGPDVKPDGREPRVKSDLRAEIPRASPAEETTTLEPFIEKFFASPSSPKPFIFRGSPAPSENRFGGNNNKENRFGDSNNDLFGSATTIKSFFVPTPKPSFAGISATPEILTLGKFTIL